MGFLKLILWLVGFGFAALVLLRSRQRDQRTGKPSGVKAKSVVVALIFVIGAMLVTATFGQVPAGTRGVVLKFGAPTGEVLGEGFFVIFPPFIKTVEYMSVQVHKYELAKADAASRDLQGVTTDVVLNYSLDPNQVVYVYRNLRRDYVERVIAPAVPEALKASTAQFTAEELITRRPAVRDEIVRILAERLGPFGIKVRALSITQFKFSESFDAAIEAKVTAEQQALKAKRDLERVKLEAQQQIEQAKAQAEALRIQKQNVTPELIELRRIEAQLKAIEKWDGHMPSVVTGSGPVPLLDVFQGQKK